MQEVLGVCNISNVIVPGNNRSKPTSSVAAASNPTRKGNVDTKANAGRLATKGHLTGSGKISLPVTSHRSKTTYQSTFRAPKGQLSAKGTNRTSSKPPKSTLTATSEGEKLVRPSINSTPDKPVGENSDSQQVGTFSLQKHGYVAVHLWEYKTV